MNWHQKYKQNTTLIKGYDAFIPEVENYEQRLKLATEIGRLCTQNIFIEQMTVEDYKQDSNDYDLKIQQQ